MDRTIKLKRPGMGIGDTRELQGSFELPSFDLYGRRHEISDARARVRVTELTISFGESEFLLGPNDPELYVEDWELKVAHYAREALPSEIPMQVFCSGTKPVSPEVDEDEIDPRWRGLTDLFVSDSQTRRI